MDINFLNYILQKNCLKRFRTHHLKLIFLKLDFNDVPVHSYEENPGTTLPNLAPKRRENKQEEGGKGRRKREGRNRKRLLTSFYIL